MTHSYDRFAPHFDAWQLAFGAPYDALILPRVLGALARHAPRARRIADLGAGTGELAVALATRGYRVIAVDRSVPMLAVARPKAAALGLAAPPEFVRQDLRTLRLERPVDAALCVYTVMNQLTDDGDLARALAATRDALVPDGVFVFELNLAASYTRYWSGSERIVLEDAVVERTHHRLPGSSVIEARVTIRPRGDRAAGEVTDRIRQRPYDDPEVETALAHAGLALLERTRFNPFAPAEPPVKALWCARRPSPTRDSVSARGGTASMPPGGESERRAAAGKAGAADLSGRAR